MLELHVVSVKVILVVLDLLGLCRAGQVRFLSLVLLVMRVECFASSR